MLRKIRYKFSNMQLRKNTLLVDNEGKSEVALFNLNIPSTQSVEISDGEAQAPSDAPVTLEGETASASPSDSVVERKVEACALSTARILSLVVSADAHEPSAELEELLSIGFDFATQSDLSIVSLVTLYSMIASLLNACVASQTDEARKMGSNFKIEANLFTIKTHKHPEQEAQSMIDIQRLNGMPADELGLAPTRLTRTL